MGARHPLVTFDRVLAIAHRGGSLVRPENTLAAFDGALAEGVDALELDVRLSKDGEPVVIHDPTLDRTTGARGDVAALTADELARVDAAYHFDADGGCPLRGRGIGVPRLLEVLARYRDLPLVIELKGESRELARRVMARIADAGAIDRVVVAGFSQVTMAEVRAISRDVKTSACIPEVRRALLRAYVGLSTPPTGYACLQIPERRGWRRVTSRRLVRAAARAGVPVHVWTVNEAAAMRRLIGWGVRGLISDRPALAVQIARSA